MRNVVLLMHVSLDGFVAGPNGEMDWIRFDDAVVEYVEQVTNEADVNLFGRVTYQMMAYYWPTAADQPGATQHDIDHANWVNSVEKVVFSSSLDTVDWNNAWVVKGGPAEEIAKLKQQPGKNMIIIGSPSFAASLMQQNLIDEYWLNVNPVAIGSGLPLFKDLAAPLNLELVAAKAFSSGVVGLHYRKA